MSIQDKIRDELYGGPADELKSEQEAAAYEELLDDNENPWLAAKDLFFYALIEAAVLALVVFAPRTVASWMGVGQALPYLILIIFGAGFLLSFRAYKLLRTTVFRKNLPTNDIIAGVYAEDLVRESQFTNWLVGAGGGVVNLVGFFLLLKVF